MATQHELTILGKNAARECAEADLANPDFLKSENADSRLEQHAQDRAMVWAYNSAVKSKTAAQAYVSTYTHLVRIGKANAKFLAKPLFDGTEASCRNRNEFWALEAALQNVRATMGEIDRMAGWLTRKASDIKVSLRQRATASEPNGYGDSTFELTPIQAAAYSGLNGCGELQGNGNIDALIVKLVAQKEAYSSLVHALGYRLTDDAASNL